MTKEITTENFTDVLAELEQAFFDIPFGNSDYQNIHFVVKAQLTPGRAYRAIGLRMFDRLRALREAQFGRMREEVDIEELEDKINDPALSKYDRRRAEIDLQEKLAHRAYTDKLIHDALAELNCLYDQFKQLPKYSREQFEKEEEIHFKKRLTRQAKGLTGPYEALANMTDELDALLLEERPQSCPPLSTTKKP